MSRKLLGFGAVACLLAGVLAGCGGASRQQKTQTAVGNSGDSVDIYSSLPMQGAVASQTLPMVQGIELALAQAGGRAGRWRIIYHKLDDSLSPTGAPDPNQIAENARTAAADTDAVYYIGEFDSAASEVSIPILTAAGIAQVGAASTDASLVAGAGAGAAHDGAHPASDTFLRIVPNGSVEAASDLMAMSQAHCARVAVANDSGLDGLALAKSLQLERHHYGVDVVGMSVLNPSASGDGVYLEAIASKHVDCFLFAGAVSPAVVRLTEAVHKELPEAKIFGSDGVCTQAWTNPADGGVPRSLDPILACTAVPLSTTNEETAQFLAAFKAKYRVGDPDPYALVGYEAMELVLQTIRKLGPTGDSKSAVLRSLLTTRERASALGTYGFLSDGQTTLRSYGLYRVGSAGELVCERVLTPAWVA